MNVLIVRTNTPAYPGVVRLLAGNPDGVSVHIVSCAWAEEAYALCENGAIDVVLVQHDADALALTKRPPKAPLVLPSHQAVVRAWDKAEVLRSCVRLGVPYPAHAVLDQETDVRAVAHRLGYPEKEIVVRPAKAWGARGICLLSGRVPSAERVFRERARFHRLTLDELEVLVSQAPPLVMTEYLSGKEFSVDAFRGVYCEVAIPRERVSVEGGIARESALTDRHALASNTLALAKEFGLTSLFGMQFRAGADGIPRILECNPRIQGTIFASHLSGINLVWLAVQEALGNPPNTLPPVQTHGRYVRPWAC